MPINGPENKEPSPLTFARLRETVPSMTLNEEVNYDPNRHQQQQPMSQLCFS